MIADQLIAVFGCVKNRMSRVAPSPTLRVTAEADRLRRQGVDVVDLGAGEPDFPTPEHIKDAARAAIDANFTKYTPSPGIMELRQAICARYRLDYGVEYRPEQTIVTAGAKQALFNAAMALFEDGDEVITHAPYWPTIPEQIKLAGATPVIVRTHAGGRFRHPRRTDDRRDHGADQGHCHQLAMQPDRRVDFGGGDGARSPTRPRRAACG